MEEGRDHILTLIIGASQPAEELRRWLVRRGLPHAGVTGHVRGLRRCLVMDEAFGPAAAVLCVSMDAATRRRYGASLAALIADARNARSLPAGARTVGLLDGAGLTPAAAGLGCDCYAASALDASSLIQTLRTELRRWRVTDARARRWAQPRRGAWGLATDGGESIWRRSMWAPGQGPFAILGADGPLELEKMDEGEHTD